ncbi:MAG: hypothetical protein M0R80_30395 [Proteobacteria bacterium]|jgi:hypothetical protein|nr:hypothetical protein [Pseudomonadota bacterium]
MKSFGTILPSAFAAGILVMVACGDEDYRLCSPGDVRECTCEGEWSGMTFESTQVCNSDGTGWYWCDCQLPDCDVDADTDSDTDDDTDADTDTNTDTDSDTHADAGADAAPSEE